MSQTRSPSTQRVYGLARVCRAWEVALDGVRDERARGGARGPTAAAQAEAAME